MDRGIRLETTSSYDENKYESLGVVNAAMSVTVSFTGATPPPAKTSFFGSAPKAAPVDKQQRLTSTENQMLQALKKQLIMNAPPGTERLIDFKISPPENIAHSPEYILSMLASATAIKKVQAQALPNTPPAMSQPLAQAPLVQPPLDAQMSPMSPMSPMSQPLAPLSQPAVLPQIPPMSQPLAQLQGQLQGQPLAQLQQGQLQRGGKKYKGKGKTKRKTRKHRK
jgi:hypothetical protein